MATKLKNPFGKGRPKDSPYAIYSNYQGWEWHVCKTYQRPDKEQGNQYARWFCFVMSPLCPEGEYGDVYISDILGGGQARLDAGSSDDEWTAHYTWHPKKSAEVGAMALLEAIFGDDMDGIHRLGTVLNGGKLH